MAGPRLRICFVTNEYPPRPIWGGAGVYAKRLTEGLAHLGHRVHVLTWGAPDNTGIENLKVHRIDTRGCPRLGEIFYGAKLPTTLIKLHGMIGGFDILHINSPEISALLSLLTSKISRPLRCIPKLVTVHHLMHDSASIPSPFHFATIRRFLTEGGWFPRLVETAVLSRVDGIIAVSEYTKTALHRAYGINYRKIHAIHHGVSYSFVDNSQAGKVRNSSSSILLLNVGRVEPRKGISVLLKAFESLSGRYKNLRLTLIGRGTRRACDSYHLSTHAKRKIRTYEWLDEKRLIAMYKTCDIYVSPSYLEGFGLSVLEAMAAGKPIVASSAGAIPEIVRQSVNGILVKPNDSKTLSDAIEDLIENKDLMYKMGKHNKEYAKSCFTWEKVAQRTVEAYLKTMDRSD